MSLRARCLVSLVLLMAACSSPPDVETIEPTRWPEALAEHRGSVTVVNVWANWCRACLDFLPGFLSLQEVEAYEDVEFLTVVVEDPADTAALDAAKALVLELDARIPHYAFQTGVEETLESLGLENLPGVLVFGADGKLRHRVEGDAFEGEMHLEDVEDAIDAALAEPMQGER